MLRKRTLWFSLGLGILSGLVLGMSPVSPCDGASFQESETTQQEEADAPQAENQSDAQSDDQQGEAPTPRARSGRGARAGTAEGGARSAPNRSGQGRFRGRGGAGGAGGSGGAQAGQTQASSDGRSAAAPAAEIKPSLPQAWLDGFKWESIGPANMSGRITSLTVYEKDPMIWWASSASGGLLKTVNNGFTFEHQFDDQAVVSIGDVQVFQGDANIVWVGTGEANPRNSVSWGNGVYKSTDGGKTWKNMGLEKTYQTGRMALHPSDANIAYVGALGRLWGDNPERGVFKTVDGGKTWEKVLFIDDKTGIIDLQMHPTNPDILLAAAYERQRDGFDGNDPGKKFGPGSGIYRTNDAGKTWKKISAGLPTCNKGRIGLNWSRSNPDHAFAIVESEKIGGGPEKQPYMGVRSQNADVGVKITDVVANSPSDNVLKTDDIVLQVAGELVLNSNEMNALIAKNQVGDEVKLMLVRSGKKEEVTLKLGERPQQARRPGSEAPKPFAASLGGQQENVQDQQGEEGVEFGGLYKSTDAGETWVRINSINPRPMYYSQVRVDPTDENNVYILGTSLYKSSDGGKTFSDDGHGNEVHVDHHALWIDGRDSRHMILGNDGGIYVSHDRMKTWDHHNHFAIGQFYHVGLDATEDYKVYGGLQDNGSWGGPRRSRNGSVINSDWFRIGGGDGFVCLVDPEDPDQLYSESQNGSMGRLNLRTGERGSIRPRAPRGVRYRFNWKTPFILSPHNSKMHYSAGNYVFRSYSKGENTTAISPEITNTSNGSGSAISESAVEAGVLYVGTTDGAVWMTKDGGQNWEAIFSQPAVEKPAADAPPTPKENAQEPAETESSAEPAKGKKQPSPADEANDDEAKGDKAKDDKTEGDKAETPKKPMKEAAAQPQETPATEKQDLVSGTWDGTFSTSDNSASGEFVMQLKLEDNGNITGTLESQDQPVELNNGQFNAETSMVSFEIKTPLGDLNPELKLTGDTVEGSVSIGNGQSLNIKASRRKKLSTRVFTIASVPAQASPESRAKSQQDESPVEQESAENEPQETGKQEADAGKADAGKADAGKADAGKADAGKAESSDNAKSFVGVWNGKMLREGETFAEFSLTLQQSTDGKISGQYNNDRGDGEVTGGKFDPQTKQLSLSIDTGRADATLTGTIDGENFAGEMEFGGRFTIDFELKRTSKTVAAKAPAAATSSDTKELGQWLPGPRWVSSLEASKHVRGRVYISLDGHRSDDDEVYLFASEDYGKTWRSLRANLPTAAGSVRVLREDISNPEVLYLGCEFSAWLSIDRGKSWSKFTGLPTVAVHEFAQHPSNGEVVAGTHGRSLWVLDVTPLRQLKTEVLSQQAHLMKPATVIRWRSLPERGSNSTREFQASTGSGGATICYVLGRRAQSVVLTIRDINGREVYREEGASEAGLQKIQWNLRRAVGAATGRRFGGAAVANGTYLLELQVDNELLSETLTILGDPKFPATGGSAAMDLMDELEALGDED